MPTLINLFPNRLSPGIVPPFLPESAIWRYPMTSMVGRVLDASVRAPFVLTGMAARGGMDLFRRVQGGGSVDWYPVPRLVLPANESGGGASRLERLRDVLYEPPSVRSWGQLRSMFARWPESEQLSVGKDYAKAGLERWPDDLRASICFRDPNKALKDPMWGLYRHIDVERGAFEGLLPYIEGVTGLRVWSLTGMMPLESLSEGLFEREGLGALKVLALRSLVFHDPAQCSGGFDLADMLQGDNGARLTHLDIDLAQQSDLDVLERLLDSPLLGQLRHLRIGYGWDWEEIIGRLLQCPACQRLESLYFDGFSGEARRVEDGEGYHGLLGELGGLGRLRALGLNRAAWLLSELPPWMKRLERLDLSIVGWLGVRSDVLARWLCNPHFGVGARLVVLATLDWRRLVELAHVVLPQSVGLSSVEACVALCEHVGVSLSEQTCESAQQLAALLGEHPDLLAAPFVRPPDFL